MGAVTKEEFLQLLQPFSKQLMSSEDLASQQTQAQWDERNAGQGYGAEWLLPPTSGIAQPVQPLPLAEQQRLAQEEAARLQAAQRQRQGFNLELDDKPFQYRRTW